jgi:hypothetical protein
MYIIRYKSKSSACWIDWRFNDENTVCDLVVYLENNEKYYNLSRINDEDFKEFLLKSCFIAGDEEGYRISYKVISCVKDYQQDFEGLNRMGYGRWEFNLLNGLCEKFKLLGFEK